MKSKWILLVGMICGGISLSAQQKETPYVILISFDGFRHDYVAKDNAPNFKEFISQGSQAEALIPSFPSKTFPNHYSLVTGLTPGHHGLVDNSFYDPKRKTIYGMRDKAKVADSYYYGGIPLWQLAKQNGMKAASYFWVGSEMSEENRRPDYYFPFDDTKDPHDRISQALNWLQLPEKERPHIITLYFSFPDHEGHDFGPNSEQAKQAVLRADSLLGDLMKGLKAIKLPVNVLLVSDHGMRELVKKPETYLFTDNIVNRRDTSVKAVDGGTHVHLYINRKTKIDSVYNALKSKEKGFKTYRKEEYPEYWNYKVDRAGEILLAADTDHYFQSGPPDRILNNINGKDRVGVHGYDAMLLKDVRGIFYAAGPNIKKGLKIPAFQNVHVYALIAEILGLPTPSIDGKKEVLHVIYKK